MTEEQVAAKAAMRKRLAAIDFSEKIAILEKLRDREKVLAAAGLRKVASENADSKRGH